MPKGIKGFQKGHSGYWLGKKRLPSHGIFKKGHPDLVSRESRIMAGKKISESQKGKIISIEAREKMRLAKLGRIIPIETRFKISFANRGENHYNWRGGITSENMTIRRSLTYRIWREKVFERDDFTCQICGGRGGELNADHIKPFALFPELRLEISNGRTLCKKHHSEVTKQQHLDNIFLNSIATRFKSKVA